MNTNVTYSFDTLSLDELKHRMVKIYKGQSQQEVLESTMFLKAYASIIQSVPVFVQLLTQEADPNLRLLSAIILKRHIIPHLSGMADGDREVLQRSILTRFFEETQRRVLRTLAALIGVMIKNSVQIDKNWTDPLVVISERTKADQPENARIQGFLLLSTILEITGEHLTAFYADLFKFFLETIRDGSATIRKQTLLCVLNMFASIPNVEPFAAFDEIYPLLLECFYHCLEEKDDDTIEKALESFITLTQKRHNLLDNAKLSKLIEVFCTGQALLCKDVNPLFRENMIDIIQNILLNCKTIVTKNEAMMRKIVEIIFTLACVKEPEEEVRDRDSIQEVALFFISQMALFLPRKKSYVIYKEYLLNMFESPNEDVVEGAFKVLGNISEGCAEPLRRDLPVIMKNFISKGLDSANPGIKKATFYAINFFSNYLIPEIIIFHPMILPPLIKNLDSLDQKTLEGNVFSLEIFCQEMNESIINYLPELIPKLIRVIDAPENLIPVKNRALLTISSCAQVAEGNFANYASEFLPLLAQLVNITDIHYIELKASAIKCVGTIVGHCIKEVPELYQKVIEPLVPVIYETLKATESTLLKEHSFEFFYNLAAFLKQDFKVYLQQIVELTFETIAKIEREIEEQKNKPKMFSLDSDSEDENANPWVDDNVIEELSAAICCLGETAMACPGEFTPYYERTVGLIANFSEHYHYNLRSQALICYKNLAKALIKLGNNGELPKYIRDRIKVLGLPCAQRFAADAEKFLYGEVYGKLLYALEFDDNIRLIIDVLDIMQELCMDLGPAAVDQKLEEIVIQLIKIFTNESNAQNQAYDEDEEEVHGDLFGSATLLVDLLMKTCRDGFLPYFEKLYPILKKFATSQDLAEDDISEVIGCFAQAAKYITNIGEQYGLDILDTCVKAIEFGDEYINNNIAYCVGNIVENGKDKIFPHYGAIMEKLRVIYENSTLPDTRDNALAAMGRLVYTNPSLVPLNVVVPSLVKEMPLKGDPKENKVLVKMLVFLFETNVEALSGLEERGIELLIDGVIERKKYGLKDENVIKAIGLILKNLSANQNGKQIIENCASKLSGENLETLKQLLTAQY